MFSRVLFNKQDYKSDYIGESMINLLDTSFELPTLYDAQVMEVTTEYIARPDLLAHDIYGDSIYADILCKVNGISNPFELNEGMYIIVPAVDEMENFIVEPSWIESKRRIPTPRAKSERRRPSDAVQGNPRFTMDTLSEIIRY